MEKIKTVKLATKHIRIDGGTQTRESLDESVVSEYAEVMQSGESFEPCVVFYDGSNNWLADGFHRYFAAVKTGKSLVCEQRQGSKRDAIFYSTGANGTHGLRRSNQTKRNAVTKLLEDAEWSARSDNWIADHCKVSHPFVAGIRKEVTCNISSQTERVARDGRVINTENIGAKASTLTPSNSTGLEDEVFPDAFDDTTPEPDEIEEFEPVPTTLQQRAADATVVRDTIGESSTTQAANEINENELTDEEWLITLPLFEYLIATGGKALLLKSDALSWRSMQQGKAFGAFKAAAHKAFNFNNASTPLSQVVSRACYLKHPREWGACVKCRAAGCSECGYAGYALDAGLTVEQLGARE